MSGFPLFSFYFIFSRLVPASLISWFVVRWKSFISNVQRQRQFSFGDSISCHFVPNGVQTTTNMSEQHFGTEINVTAFLNDKSGEGWSKRCHFRSWCVYRQSHFQTHTCRPTDRQTDRRRVKPKTKPKHTRRSMNILRLLWNESCAMMMACGVLVIPIPFIGRLCDFCMHLDEGGQLTRLCVCAKPPATFEWWQWWCDDAASPNLWKQLRVESS